MYTWNSLPAADDFIPFSKTYCCLVPRPGQCISSFLASTLSIVSFYHILVEATLPDCFPHQQTFFAVCWPVLSLLSFEKVFLLVEPRENLVFAVVGHKNFFSLFCVSSALWWIRSRWEHIPFYRNCLRSTKQRFLSQLVIWMVSMLLCYWFILSLY